MEADGGRDGYCVTVMVGVGVGWVAVVVLGASEGVGAGVAVGVGAVGELVGSPGAGWLATPQGSANIRSRDGAEMMTPSTEVGAVGLLVGSGSGCSAIVGTAIVGAVVGAGVVGTGVVRGGTVGGGTVGAGRGVLGEALTTRVTVTAGAAGREDVGLVGTAGAARCRGAEDVVRGTAVGVAGWVGAR